LEKEEKEGSRQDIPAIKQIEFGSCFYQCRLPFPRREYSKKDPGRNSVEARPTDWLSNHMQPDERAIQLSGVYLRGDAHIRLCYALKFLGCSHNV
jgi:hypothetical protein